MGSSDNLKTMEYDNSGRKLEDEETEIAPANKKYKKDGNLAESNIDSDDEDMKLVSEETHNKEQVSWRFCR